MLQEPCILSAQRFLTEIKWKPNFSGQLPIECYQPLLCGAKDPGTELEDNGTTAGGMRQDTFESFHLI